MKPAIYIASKFSSRYRLRPIKARLQSLGFPVVSKWMDTDNPTDSSSDYDSIGDDPKQSLEEAERDCWEIPKATIFIIDTQEESLSGGRDVELGIAIAECCKLFRVGPARNVFHFKCMEFKTWPDLIYYLERNHHD